MMANDDQLPLPTNSTELRSPYSAAVAESDNGESDANVASLASSSTRPNELVACLHALRRHWFLAFGVGLLCAALAGPAVWLGVPAEYTAYATFRVAMQEDRILSQDSESVNTAFYDIYKSTQSELIHNRLVLLAALRRPEVTTLACAQDPKNDADWLAKQVSVNFPGRAELMVVSLKRHDPREAKVLVQAVCDAYVSEVVEKEKAKKTDQFLALVKVCDSKEAEIRDKRQQLKRLVSANGGVAGEEALSVRQKLLLEELAMHNQEYARMQFEMNKLAAELAGQKALLKSADEQKLPAADIDLMVRMDPVASQLSMELSSKKMMQANTELYAKDSKNGKNGYVSRYGNEANMLQKQYDERVADMQKRAQERNRRAIEMEVTRLESLLLGMQSQSKTLASQVEKMRTTAEKFGNTSLDVEMLNLDLKQLETTCTNFNAEREKLEAERRNMSRITPLESAEEPKTPSNTLVRVALVAMASLAGFVLPGCFIVLWDMRAKRINTVDDVAEGLRLPVIGSVPLIPSRVIRQMASPSSKYRSWHLRLTESVDGVMARLLHKANLEQCRVIMVSSAVASEGKTTLATQLALSLARTGRRTVLVDFDLRRPAFDEVFGLPLTPGVSESLRKECVAADLIHETSTECLSVVTAGQWDRQALASLSNGGAAMLFDELREKFDFIVVDSSPILPIADPRFVSQFVDTVVLSVFRDISEAPKIQAACSILQAFGVQSIEAVVTGPNVHAYGKHMGYESTISA